MIHGRTRDEGSAMAAAVGVVLDVLKPSTVALSGNLRPLSAQTGLRVAPDHEVRQGQFDLVVSLGGDGTMLEAALMCGPSNTPILGINMGRLGFLTATGANGMAEALGHVYQGDFSIEQRSTIQLVTENQLFGADNVALNELSVHKARSSSMVVIDAWVDGVFLNTYWSDGLIVSTPTGSTGYSLSAGGPILLPGSGSLAITPLAPHNLTVRPLVVPDSALIELRVRSKDPDVLISLDSRSVEAGPETVLQVQKAPYTIGMVRLPNTNHLNTLRDKLMWGRDLRN